MPRSISRLFVFCILFCTGQSSLGDEFDLGALYEADEFFDPNSSSVSFGVIARQQMGVRVESVSRDFFRPPTNKIRIIQRLEASRTISPEAETETQIKRRGPSQSESVDEPPEDLGKQADADSRKGPRVGSLGSFQNNQPGYNQGNYRQGLGSGNVEVRNGFVYQKPQPKAQPNNPSNRGPRVASAEPKNSGLAALAANRSNFGSSAKRDDDEDSRGQSMASPMSSRTGGSLGRGPQASSNKFNNQANSKKKKKAKSALDKIADSLGLNRFFGALGGSKLGAAFKRFLPKGRSLTNGSRSVASVDPSQPNLQDIFNNYSANADTLIIDDTHSILYAVCENFKVYGKINNLVGGTQPCSDD